MSHHLKVVHKTFVYIKIVCEANLLKKCYARYIMLRSYMFYKIHIGIGYNYLWKRARPQIPLLGVCQKPKQTCNRQPALILYYIFNIMHYALVEVKVECAKSRCWADCWSFANMHNITNKEEEEEDLILYLYTIYIGHIIKSFFISTTQIRKVG